MTEDDHRQNIDVSTSKPSAWESMTDASLRGALLQCLYERRRETTGGAAGYVRLDAYEDDRLLDWLPVPEQTRLLIHLHEHGVITLDSSSSFDGLYVHGVSITARGVDVIEGNAPTPVAVTISGHNVMVGNYNQQH